MAIILPKNGKTYRYDFTVNGVNYRGSTGINYPNEAAARKFEANLKAEKKADAKRSAKQMEAKRTLGIVDSKGRTIIPNFLEAVDAYWDNQGKNAANAAEDFQYLMWLTDVIEAKTLVTNVRNKTVEMVVNTRAAMPKLSKPRRDRRTGEIIPGKPQVIDFETQAPRPYVEGNDDPRHIIRVAPATVNRSSIDILKRVILYARDTLEVPGMPGIKWRDYRLKEPKGRKRTLSHVEEAQIEDHLREGYGAAFRFALKAGYRLENFTEKFKWGSVNFDTRTITIIQKGGTEHTSVMTDEMEAILREQVGRDPRHVFMFRFKGRGSNPKPWKNPRNGKVYIPGHLYPVTYWGFDAWFDDVKAATGITDLCIHDLRRTAASRVIRAIGNPKTASRLLGHGSEHMIMTVYGQIRDDEAFEDLNEADRRIAAQRDRELARRASAKSPTSKLRQEPR
jgi:integrase